MKHKGFLLSLLILVVFAISYIGYYNSVYALGSTPNSDEVAKQSRKKMRNTQNLFEKQRTPIIKWSMDRYLLDQRLRRFNDPNKMNYLYVCFPSGEWLQFTIVGKLASTSKRLTPPVKQYKIDRGSNYGTDLGPAPDEMGVFGHSLPAKLGMTTLGSLFEMGGFVAYIYSETPLNFKNMTSKMIEIEVQATDEEKAQFSKKLQGVKSEHNKSNK